MFWTDDNAADFIEKHHSELFPTYQNYEQLVRRADLLRYALLEHFGGVYLDLDVTCLQPLDDLLNLPWLTPGAYPTGINNAFILSRPHHPLLHELLRRMPNHNLRWPLPYIETMLSTGCMYFSYQWLRYARRLSQTRESIAEEDMVFILADEDGNMDAHMLRGKVTTPLFSHGGASSWHEWDAAAIVLMGKHYGKFCIVMCCCMVAMTLLAFRVMRCLTKRAAVRTECSNGLSEDEEQLRDCKEG